MSAQPYTPEEIADARPYYAQEPNFAYRKPPTMRECFDNQRRWLATFDDLTSRLDAATRERDELRAKLSGAEKERGELLTSLRGAADRIFYLAMDRDALVKAIDTDGSLKTVEACVDAMPDLHHAYSQLAAIEKIEAERDAATRRADEVERAMGAARLLLFAAHPSSELPGRYIVSKHDIDTLRAAVHRLDAALSTGSTPATTANPGDKADRIDAAKEGRHA